MAEKKDVSTSTPLSLWDQASSRFHIRLVLCFELDNSKRDQVVSHLGNVLRQLSRSRPDLAGRLHLGERRGWIHLRESPDFQIPLEVMDGEKIFRIDDYKELRERSFPAAAFLGADMFTYQGAVVSSKSEVPVAAVRIIFIDGGMLLATFLHHGFGDGECLKEFLEAFSAQSRGETVSVPGNRSLDFAKKKNNKKEQDDEICSEKAPSFHQLLEKCPEYVESLELEGPNQPTYRPGGLNESDYRKDGKIFVFTSDKIQKLKDLVMKHAPSDRPPSSYVCLATLFWAHAAQARMDFEAEEESWECDGLAMMTNPVNWRLRAFRDENKSYYGNSATLAQTCVEKDELQLACEKPEFWARLVRKVEAAIRKIDDDFVRQRVELFEAAPDPRSLCLLIDPRIPQDLAFNTWRDFGADTEWDLYGEGPGAKGVGGGIIKADALRRSQDHWNLGGTLILPARQSSDEYEVLLTIPRDAMEELCDDENFMCWVTRVIE